MDKKKKICILSNGLWRGGTDTFVVNLARELDKQKYDITVILSISEEWLAAREADVLDAGVKTYRTHGITNKGITGRMKHLVRLYMFLKQEKPDVFQTNIDLFNGPNLFVAWLAGVPVRICHSHNSMQEREAANGRSASIAIYQGVMRWLCWTFSNRRAGCSEAALDFLFQDKWKSDPGAIVVNNGIAIDRFRTGVDTAKILRGIGASAKHHILTVGRLSAQKNPMMIADVFIELCKKRDDCDLIWVGIGEMEADVKARLRDCGVLDKVIFLGIRDDVNELMQCGDVFLFPSLFEGLGIVVIEAQAAGLPCVLSDTIPAMVDCGGCCFLSLTDSPSRWAEKVSDVLSGKEKFRVDDTRLESLFE